MDFATVTTAAALLAVLLAWYALLEYEDRRRGKGESRPRRAPVEGGESLLRVRRRAGAVPRQNWRSNGHHPPARGAYGLAATGVLVAYALVALGDLLFSFPPFIFFAAAVAAALTLWGRGPGLFALLLATLLSDFFFVEPAFVLSLDWQVFRLSLVYLLGGLLSVFISRRLAPRLSA